MLLLSAFLLLPTLYFLTNAQKVRAISAAALVDPLAVFAARSPGARGAGALAQSKPHYATKPSSRIVPPVAPSERVLANVRTRSPLVPDEAPFAFPVPEPAGELPPVLPAELGELPGLTLPGSAPVPVGGGPTFFPVSPGGGGIIVPATSAVPEPATWGMMLSGFLWVGALIRRRTRNAIGPASFMPSIRTA